jgi:hypothetical protein
MVAITEEELLRQLSLYKWKDGYRCHKCGNENYKKGKTSHSRRCTDRACDYDESVIHFTIFEGIKFPVTKAYGIVEYFVNSCFLDHDERALEKGLRRKETGAERGIEDLYNAGEAISVNDLMVEYVAAQANVPKSPKDPAGYQRKLYEISELYSDKLRDYYESRKPKVAELSQIFMVEENTVNKLLKKLYQRMRMIDTRDSDYNYDKEFIDYLVSQFNEVKDAFSKFLPYFMLPLPVPLVKGTVRMHGKWYWLDERNWELDVMTFSRKGEDGIYRNYYNKEDEPEYLCEEES